MKYKAKTISTVCPIWVEGEYITKPPIRPVDRQERPEGHYIDKGGYPGANVYEIDIKTLCRATEYKDKKDKVIYSKDFLLFETEEEIGYFVVENMEEPIAVDIAYGEIIAVKDLNIKEIKVIGNAVDNGGFAKCICRYVELGEQLPYVPMINIQVSDLPYYKLACRKCHNKVLSCMYTNVCPKCGGFADCEFTTPIRREKEKTFA